MEEGCVPAEEAGLWQAGPRVGGAGGVGVSSLSPDMGAEPQDAHPESGEGFAESSLSGKQWGASLSVSGAERPEGPARGLPALSPDRGRLGAPGQQV